jgi:hypothetical protein
MNSFMRCDQIWQSFQESMKKILLLTLLGAILHKLLLKNIDRDDNFTIYRKIGGSIISYPHFH